jgi:hypothetical protein
MSELQGEVMKVGAGKNATCRGFDEGRKIRVLSGSSKDESPKRLRHEVEFGKLRGVNG